MSDLVTGIWSWYGEELVGKLLVTMLHFLWQAAVVAGLARLIAIALKGAPPRVRYAMYCAAMASLPVCLAITFFVTDVPVRTQATNLTSEVVSGLRLDSAFANAGDNAARDPQAIVAIENSASVNRRASLSALGSRFPDAALWIVSAYLLGVGCFLMRLMAGIWGGNRLRDRATVIRDARLCQQIADQAQQLRLRSVPVVAYCQCVTVPTVVGLLRPMILLPTALMTGLTPEDLNAILRHEFAHIRRFDLWMNLGQRILESLLFFHPAVWWLSRRISSERELCCDDVVVSSGYRSIDYAGALLRMAERCAKAKRAGVFELAADGQNRSLLEQRIQRLIGGNRNSHLLLHRGGLAALVLVLVALVMIPCVTMHFAQSQTSVRSSPPVTQNQDDPFASGSDDPFGSPTQAQVDAANDAAFPPGIFGNEDHESTKKQVLRWIEQARSTKPAEREAVIGPLSKYFGASEQIQRVLFRLSGDPVKRVRATASRVFFLMADEIDREANTIKRLRFQMVFAMVRDDVPSDVTVPFLIETLKSGNKDERGGVGLLIVQMLRQGHREVLGQVIQSKEDPGIVDKNEYHRFIEVLRDELMQITKAEMEAAKRQSSKVSAKHVVDPLGANAENGEPFGNPFIGSDANGAALADPFGPPKPATAAEAANAAGLAFAALEKPAIVAELSAAEARIHSALNDETSVDFRNTPLQEAMQRIGREHKIPIVVNLQDLEEFGLAPDVPVSLNLKNVSLRSTLRLLLMQLELEFMIQDDVLQITTDAQMRATSLSRKYRTDQLPYQSEDIARSLQRVLDAMTLAGDAKPVVEYLSGNAGKPGILWVQANAAAQREALARLNWLLEQ